MGKLPLKAHEGKQTRGGKRPNGSTKGISRSPELGKKRLLSKLGLWMRHQQKGRTRFCFFSTSRKREKRKGPIVRSSPFCGLHPGENVEICLQVQGDTDGDRKVPEPSPGQTPEQGQRPTSDVADSTSIPTPTDCPNSTGQTKRQRRKRTKSLDRCMDSHSMNNGFEKTAGGQEPRSDPVCPREACTVPDAEQAMADGRTSSRTTLSPGCVALPGCGVVALTRINEFLDGFCKVYGSLIPLERCDILGCVKWPCMTIQKRNGLVNCVVRRYKSTVARASPSFQVVYKRHTLTLADLSTLAEHNWLNDQVINMYGELIRESTGDKVHFLNTFFHQQLEAKGYEGVRRWTKQVSLFSKQLLLVPVHQEVHWCLVAAEPARRTVRLYDSSECAAPPEVALEIQKYLTSEAKEKRLQDFQTGWAVSANKRTPQQSNENDCGVFILEYCKRLAFKEPLTFSQKDIPNIRKRIYKELCERKLHV